MRTPVQASDRSYQEFVPQHLHHLPLVLGEEAASSPRRLPADRDLVRRDGIQRKAKGVKATPRKPAYGATDHRDPGHRIISDPICDHRARIISDPICDHRATDKGQRSSWGYRRAMCACVSTGLGVTDTGLQ